MDYTVTAKMMVTSNSFCRVQATFNDPNTTRMDRRLRCREHSCLTSSQLAVRTIPN